MVFVCAGRNSLHSDYMSQDPARNWDCCVSWYSPPREEALAEYYIIGKDNKFESFLHFYNTVPEAKGYRYYLLVDDDVAFAPQDISRFFSLCERHRLYVSAPALKWGTYANHDVTLYNPMCEARQVAYVEVMTPCFSKQALEALSGTFLLTKSTWGIDYAWSSLLAGQGKIAVVDAIQVEHTKAPDLGGGAFYQKLKSMGVDVGEEYAAIKRNYPSFGGFNTVRHGHVYKHGLPDFLGWPLTRLWDRLNKRIHRRRLRRRGNH